MSKTTIFLILVVIAAGLAIGFYYGFSPFQTIQSLIQNPTAFLPQAWAFVQQHWQALVGGISGVFGTLALAARAYSQHKQQTQHNLNQIKSESAIAITQLQTKNQTLETRLSQTNENFATFSENYVKVQGQLQDVTAEKNQLSKQLTDERAYYEKKIKDLENKKKPVYVP